MRFVTLIALGFCGLLQIAPSIAIAQIISQNPSPVIQTDETSLIETTKLTEEIGEGAHYTQVPRAGALLFAGFDHNNDYSIDIGEVNAGINQAFNFADKDKNGTLSLIELEVWRKIALGSENLAPHSYAFAPNFARTVTKDKFHLVLSELAKRLDKDVQGLSDGKIAMEDLLKNHTSGVSRGDAERTCRSRINDERRRVQQ